MDGRGFDDLTRRFATKRPRRAVLKGLLGLGAAVATTVSRESGGAAWSTLVCLPDGSGDYVQRLVPTAAVPFYLSQYGAVLPENGSCPCPAPPICAETCSGCDFCLGLADCGTACSNDVTWSCGLPCASDNDCTNPNAPICLTSVIQVQLGENFLDCESACGVNLSP